MMFNNNYDYLSKDIDKTYCVVMGEMFQRLGFTAARLQFFEIKVCEQNIND